MEMTMDEFEGSDEGDDVFSALSETAKPGSPWPWVVIVIAVVALWWLSKR